MVRIHDALDNATLDSGSTSGATEQDETLGQAAFDLHLDEIPLEQMQEGGVGPSHTVASGDVEHRSVSQQPDMKLVVISNRGAPFDPNKPQTGGLAAALEPVVERSGAVWMFSSENRGDGTERPLPLVKAGVGHVAELDLPAAHHRGYYRDYSNSTLWPVLHSLSDRMSRAEEGYDSYRQMNSFIARAAFDLRDRDAFWVHDYHLLRSGAICTISASSGRPASFCTRHGRRPT
ncbi:MULTISPECIES: trehalose-6-phosphate synthase [Bradyrhizobium]|uniref:Trehalose-6-phosphate synthase n=1 Tax=Bradyrhizobium diazoefficiens TaxID=1355477 RepID=A0A809YC78_9BRAD|nr:trehalose-6-phosphate synthase [Bradyrhizobium diazoefficiens]MBP1059261.1 hypothetical protein [Bradyrhizobium japonicum]WLB37194.1 trehalose-6-phosphate synthase [Bradyrhizobium diazoefficiens]WLC17884.1 trehalose-6-phosphate synthase [Bradyrhizobium diazoefficiens]BCA01164.1 hypothetical protein H12S4_20680 [Bradyrhizobium diazoefficiens]BCA01474.1 hypothetical protein H12S4_23780 [Bradyrhizobium diazoefficiens]